jgi:cytochrome oxidase Cu insertion factor (SCO1/SenC/PrrC family)
MTASRKTLSILMLAFVLVFSASGVAPALQVGDKAPDFELESSKGGKLKLSSLKGKNVLINFYVLDFSPT